MGNACYYSIEKVLSSSLLSKNLKVRIYKTVVLPVVLYGCETWTLTLRAEHRLRVFKNKVLRKIFGSKRDEVTGEWRKLHNAEVHALYPSPDIIRNIKSRRLRWAGHVARMGESRNAYKVLVGRPEVKRPLGRPRRRWEDNIKMDLREVGYEDRDWINLAQDRDQWRAYVRAAMNLRLVYTTAAVRLFSVCKQVIGVDQVWGGKGKEMTEEERQIAIRCFRQGKSFKDIDKSKFTILKSDEQIKVWLQKICELDFKNLAATIKLGEGSVLVWGCKSANGVGDLYFIYGIMDHNLYIRILMSHLANSVTIYSHKTTTPNIPPSTQDCGCSTKPPAG
ncbi:hypothetical protein ANN_12922 [Periplaneta americana]|uniref:Uncharacterized protein n=1 Tax=Periplaneta americana TaxID=6978 RepID=A0ABQ8TIZ4_PERAM|nr:hypothetical protein ANN_12922 [Periplaneta americana]